MEILRIKHVLGVRPLYWWKEAIQEDLVECVFILNFAFVFPLFIASVAKLLKNFRMHSPINQKSLTKYKIRKHFIDYNDLPNTLNTPKPIL